MVTGMHASIVMVEPKRLFRENYAPWKSGSDNISLSTLNLLCREDSWNGTKAD